jgi:hypothetical protein
MFEGSRAAAKKRQKYAKWQTKNNQESLSLQIVCTVLIAPIGRCFRGQPLNPNVLSGEKVESIQEDEARLTPLHDLAALVDSNDYSTYESQIIPAI